MTLTAAMKVSQLAQIDTACLDHDRHNMLSGVNGS
jgi:hypothetical protein